MLFGRRPCGRLLPTASRRSAWAALRAYFALYLPYPFTFPPSTTRRSQPCRLQVGAPPGWRSVLILPFTCPTPLPSRRVQLGAPSPADCKSALRLGGALCLFCPLPALPLGCPPSTTRRSQFPLGCPPSTTRRSQFPLGCPFPLLSFPSPILPAEYNSALRPGLGAGGGVVGEVGAGGECAAEAEVAGGAGGVGDFVDGGGVDGVHAHFEDVAAEGALVGAVLPGAAVGAGAGFGGEVVVTFAVGAVVGASGALVGGGMLIGVIDVVGDVDAG